jgi:hypothetical protein
MKTISATSKGICIIYENGKSSFIQYSEELNTSRVQNNYFEMNEIQRNMYRRLMYGINSYTSEEINTMSEIIKYNIAKDHKKAVNVINKLKYDKFFGAYNKLLAVIFPHVKLDYYKDGQDIPTPSLKELKINTVNIIDAWINEKLLPLNFYSLNEETISL